eukprot:g7058.t1
MESKLPRSVLFVEDIEGLGAEYRGAYALHGGSDGRGYSAEEPAAYKRGGRDEIFARPHRAAGRLDVPRAVEDKSNDRSSAAYYSQYRQRCNSAVYHKADFRAPRRTAQLGRAAAQQAAPSVGDGGRDDGGHPVVFSPGPAASTGSRSPSGEEGGRTAVLAARPDSSSLVPPASSRTYHHPDQLVVRKRYVKSKGRPMSSEERRADSRRAHRSPTASAPELAVSDGDVARRGRTVEERMPRRHGEEGPPTLRRSLSRASVVLQGDVDEVMKMVRRLHGRLSDAACWTRNLQEDTEASREKVSSLISQVRQLSRGMTPATRTPAKHERTVGADDEPEARARVAGEETHALGGDGNGGGGGSKAERRSCERGEKNEPQRASPRSTRSSSRSSSSRCSSPAGSSQSTINSAGSSLPSSRPGSPASLSSACGSMAPMYSPVALTDEVAAAAATDSTLQGGTGSCEASTDLARDAAEVGGGERGTEEGMGGGKHDAKEPSAASDEGGHRLAGTTAPGRGIKVNTTQINDRETKQQPDNKQGTRQNSDGEAKRQPNKWKSGNRKGCGRPQTKPSRRRKQTAADKGSGGDTGNPDVDKRGPTRPSSPDSAPDKGRGGSASPPRSGWGSERERGGVSPRSTSGSPRGRRRRRRGAGHGGAHGGKTPRDHGGKVQDPHGAAGSDDYGTQPITGAVLVAGENAGEPDPTEAETMLRALAGLSTTLRRLCRAEEGSVERAADGSTKQPRASLRGGAEARGDGGDEERAPGAAGCGDAEKGLLRNVSPALVMGGGGLVQPNARTPAEEDQEPASAASAFTPVGGVGGDGHSITAPPQACERCLQLSETLEVLRERARMQQRLLEHSDKLLVVATQRPDGRAEAAAPTPTATAHGAPSEMAAPTPTPADREGGGPGNEHPGASVHHAGPAETAAEVGAAAAAPPAAEAGGENEELLAAAEAVWRMSELSRSALEEELDRREDAMAAASKAARESKEALSEQVQEVARLKVALRRKEEEAEKWKGEAERSISKEKDSRRTLESARVAASDALRRSEREGKALKTEADELKGKVAALRTRLAGVLARRQAECELAAKKAEQLENTISSLETALDKQQPRQPQPQPQPRPQLQPPQEQQHHPEPSRFLSAPRFPNDGHVSDGQNGGGCGGGVTPATTPPRRRYSSASRGGAEAPLGSVRESAGRRRTYGSPAEVEAAGALAAVWERYYGAVGGGHSQQSLEAEDPGRQQFSEEDDDESLDESLPDADPDGRGAPPWSPRRQSSAWEEGGQRAGAGPVVATRSRGAGGGGDVGGGGGGVRSMSAPAPPLPPSRRSSLSPSPSRVPTEPSFAAVGGGGEFFGEGGRRRASRRSFSSSTTGGFHEGTSRGSGGGGSATGGVRRRVSSGMAVDVEEGRWRISSSAGYRKPRPRRVSAPVHAERFAEAARRADIERLLRRASQSHPPPPPTDQPRDGGKDGRERKGKEGPGGWRGLLKAALSLREGQFTGNTGDDDGQRQSPDLRKNRSLEDGDGGGGGGGGGFDGGIRGGRTAPGENAASPTQTAANTTSVVVEAPTGTQRASGGTGDTDQAERGGIEAETGERQQEHDSRQPGPGERGSRDASGGGNKEVLPGIDSPRMEKVGRSRGEDGEMGPAAQEGGVDEEGASQEGPRARHGPEDDAQDTDPEGGEPSAWPVGYRPPPEEFWRAVEGRALSSRELEGALDGVTEEEAERYLRDKGVVDTEGNIKTPSSKG